MFDRFERPVKIICLAMAALLVWQLGGLILRGDPLAKLKIPALPTLPETTNGPAKLAQKETNAAVVKNTGTNGTKATIGTNAAKGTNMAEGTNAVKGTNVVHGTNAVVKSTNAPTASETGHSNASSGPAAGMAGLPPGMTPEMMASLPPEILAQMMSGGMPGGPGGGGMKKIELPTEIQARVDRIIESEILGSVIRPMPMALIGIADQEAFIRATNGQTGPVKVGGEMGGIKLLRIGVNRVLVEQDGEKKELTVFGGLGGESLLPKPTNAPSTNAPSTNAPTRRASTRKAAAHKDSTNQTLSSKQKETQ